MIAPEEVDLARLAGTFARVPRAEREGFVVGRTHLRDCVADDLHCSLAMAEQLVETMVARGFLRFSSVEASTHGVWLLVDE